MPFKKRRNENLCEPKLVEMDPQCMDQEEMKVTIHCAKTEEERT